MNQPRKQSAFTLIELILVMAIIATVMALAAPSLSRWKRGSKLTNAADEFIAATRWARSRAVADGAVYEILVDKGSGTYRLQIQTGQTFGDVDGQSFRLPVVLDALQIESTVEAIRFFPTGRTDPATVKITAEDGDTISVRCTTPASDFALVGSEPT